MNYAHQCPECNGSGLRKCKEGEWPFPTHCPNCSGDGWIDDNGQPVSLADMKEDEHEHE